MDGVGSSAWQCRHACFNEKFFLTMLTNNSLSGSHFANVNSHLMPNKWAADRSDLSKLIREKGLHFHTLSHAQYATMVLVHSIATEQRANKIEDHIQLPAGLGNMVGGGASAAHLVGVGSAHLGRDNYPFHTSSIRGTHVGVDHNHHHYRLLCPSVEPIPTPVQALPRAWDPHSMHPMTSLKTADPRMLARGVVGAGVGGAEGHGIGGRLGGIPFAPMATSLYPTLNPAQRLAQDTAKNMLSILKGRSWSGAEEEHGSVAGAGVAGHGMGRSSAGPWQAYLGEMEQDEYGLKTWVGAGGVAHTHVQQGGHCAHHGRARVPSAVGGDPGFSSGMEMDRLIEGDAERDRSGEVPLAVDLRDILREGTDFLDEAVKGVLDACNLTLVYAHFFAMQASSFASLIGKSTAGGRKLESRHRGGPETYRARSGRGRM